MELRQKLINSVRSVMIDAEENKDVLEYISQIEGVIEKYGDDVVFIQYTNIYEYPACIITNKFRVEELKTRVLDRDLDGILFKDIDMNEFIRNFYIYMQTNIEY